MDRIRAGKLAKALAGREKGTVYIITEVEDTYVYVADGKYRTLQRPKRKNTKHIQIINKEYDLTGMDDAKLIRVLSYYN